MPRSRGGPQRRWRPGPSRSPAASRCPSSFPPRPPSSHLRPGGAGSPVRGLEDGLAGGTDVSRCAAVSGALRVLPGTWEPFRVASTRDGGDKRLEFGHCIPAQRSRRRDVRQQERGMTGFLHYDHLARTLVSRNVVTLKDILSSSRSLSSVSASGSGAPTGPVSPTASVGQMK